MIIPSVHDFRANVILYCRADENFNENIHMEKCPLNKLEASHRELARQNHDSEAENSALGSLNDISVLRKFRKTFKIK